MYTEMTCAAATCSPSAEQEKCCCPGKGLSARDRELASVGSCKLHKPDPTSNELQNLEDLEA